MANLIARPEKQEDGSIKTVLRHPRAGQDSVWTLHFRGGPLEGVTKLYPYLPDTFAKAGVTYELVDSDKTTRTAYLKLKG